MENQENKNIETETIIQEEDKSSEKPQIEKQWYIITTASTHEKKVQENLTRRVASWNLQNHIFRIVVAEHQVPILKNGQPTGKFKMKNLYPGYVFVEMIMTDEAWFVVRNTPNVTGFIGSSGGGTKPFVVPRAEMEPVLKRMGIVDKEMYSNYKVGDLVRILIGSFEGSEGNIVSIDSETNEVVISTIFFGRPTTINVKFSEIEKI